MKIRQYSRSRLSILLATGLTLGGALYLAKPVLADGTAAGTSIRNTATGTFTDGTTTYNATSNEVIIEVSEIAGVNLTAQTPSNAAPNAGDTLFVDYVVTNTGNDPTQFFIPGTATLSNTAAFAQNGQIQIVAVNGTNLGAPVNVPAAGGATGTLLGATQGSLAANPGTGTTGTITVRVPIQALATATAGQSTTVALGQTTPTNGQNLDRAVSGSSAADLYTVDNANGVGGETNTTAPTNGVREAMATSSTITVNARLQAFSSILKAVSSYSNNSTPNNLADDVLTYQLALRVDNPTTPPAGLVTSDLYGTRISVDGSTTTPYVLVSDSIPAGLQLAATNPVAPAGWTVVYSQSPLTTSALTAAWTTTRPTTGITRVGFVFNTSTAPLSKGSVGVGNVISGFSMAMTPSAGFTGGQVSNIAQVFGQSQPGPVVPGTSTQIVYDESGDQTSNNGLDGNNPDPATGGTPANAGGITDGVANPANDGTDPGTGNDPTNTGNTNTGGDTANGTKTVGGEVTPFTIAATPLNGPNGQPAAVGPTNNNDDYTNKSIVVPANLPPTTPLTDAQTTPTVFTNTVQNTSGGSQVISLLPVPPATATQLPDGTIVTMTDPATGTSATYSYTSASGFAFVSGTGGTSATNPVKLTVPGGADANYTLTVDLPGNLPQLTEFPIPVVAFVDTANDGSPTGDPSNTTIDYLYTSYLSLVKEARVLEADATTPVSGTAGTFGTDQAALTAAAIPGRVIEYRITYRNLSRTGGTNNATLPANNLVLTENGSAGNNNWATSTFDPKYPANPNGSAVDPLGTIVVTTGGTPADIQSYVNTVPSVAPGTTGSFIFQRKIK